MSQEEDTELKELVTEALEKNGVLAKIRAQLRASIFKTLENEHGQTHLNPRLKDILSTHDGLMTFLLIQELLDFCNLIETSMLFKSESGQGKAYIYEGRQPLLDHFKFAIAKEDCNSPILVHLIKLLFKFTASQFNSVTAPTISDINANNSDISNDSEDNANVGLQNNTFVVNSGRSDNYDFSFVSDSESSNLTDDKSKNVPNSRQTSSPNSSECLSTEISDMKKVDDDLMSPKSEDSLKHDESTKEPSESVQIVSEVLLNDSSKEPSLSADDFSQKTENDLSIKLNTKDTNKVSKNPINSYSKYLSERQKPINSKDSIVSLDTPVIDTVMKHFINSRLNSAYRLENTSDESLSEEIMQVFENDANSKENTISENASKSVKTETASSSSHSLLDEILADSPKANGPSNNTDRSPPRNLLDETLAETPKTKQRVLKNINSLKQNQSTLIQLHDNKVGDGIFTFFNHQHSTLQDGILKDSKNSDKNNIISKQKYNTLQDKKHLNDASLIIKPPHVGDLFPSKTIDTVNNIDIQKTTFERNSNKNVNIKNEKNKLLKDSSAAEKDEKTDSAKVNVPSLISNKVLPLYNSDASEKNIQQSVVVSNKNILVDNDKELSIKNWKGS